MKTIGLDIGTTTVCGVLVEGETGQLLAARTLPNDAALPGAHPWERLQSPVRLETLCRTLIDGFRGDGSPIAGIGISNQMHGMLYTDALGNAVSPLYTWQDERGNQPYAPGVRYAQQLSACTGYAMATGYGLTTHWVNALQGSLPASASQMATIGDYVAMRLTGVHRPRMHATNAASLGLFDLANGSFDSAALKAAGIAAAWLPAVDANAEIMGYTPDGMAVSLAIGDNQAGFYGSGSGADTVFVNIGTSGQVSMLTREAIPAREIEVRPYLGAQRLAAGCSLCGGDAYAALKRFFESTAEMLGVSAQDPYPKMNAAAEVLYAQPARTAGLTVDTRLRGTRTDAAVRGGVSGLGADTFTPAHLTLGVLGGICEELHRFAHQIPGFGQAKRLVGSGNGLRKNRLLQRIFSDAFAMPMLIPLYEEEAAYGVALLSQVALGAHASLEAAQTLIPYQNFDR